jgi:hypothetical protein
VRWAPGIGPLARKVYGHLPESWHDTPTSRLRAFYADREEVTFIQIGTYDGTAGDPLRPIVVADERWRGGLEATVLGNIEASHSGRYGVGDESAGELRIPDKGVRSRYDCMASRAGLKAQLKHH